MKSYFEEHDGTYTQVGDVPIPDPVMDQQPEVEIPRSIRFFRSFFLQNENSSSSLSVGIHFCLN